MGAFSGIKNSSSLMLKKLKDTGSIMGLVAAELKAIPKERLSQAVSDPETLEALAEDIAQRVEKKTGHTVSREAFTKVLRHRHKKAMKKHGPKGRYQRATV